MQTPGVTTPTGPGLLPAPPTGATSAVAVTSDLVGWTPMVDPHKGVFKPDAPLLLWFHCYTMTAVVKLAHIKTIVCSRGAYQVFPQQAHKKQKTLFLQQSQLFTGNLRVLYMVSGQLCKYIYCKGTKYIVCDAQTGLPLQHDDHSCVHMLSMGVFDGMQADALKA